MRKVNKKYSLIAGIALAVLSTLVAIFCIYQPKRAIIAKAVPYTDFSMSSSYGITENNNPQVSFVMAGYGYNFGTTDWEISMDSIDQYNNLWYKQRVHTSLLLFRSTSSATFSNEFNGNYTYLQKNYEFINVTDTGSRTVEWLNYGNNYAPDYYYFMMVIIRTERYEEKTFGPKGDLNDWSKATLKDTYKIEIKTRNQIHFSMQDYAYEKLTSGAMDNTDTATLQRYRKIAGYSTNTGNINVVFKYKNTLIQNDSETSWQTENYQVENLKSLSGTYVYNRVMALSNKSALSDFNVVREEVGYTINGNTDSAFLQDVYTLLEAKGYEYRFNKDSNRGELTITYGEFAAKDFTLTVRTNDDKHSALFIRSRDIKTINGTTTITFDTSNIKTRLSNNFNWNVDNTDFNNYIFTNPHGGKVAFKKNLTGTDVTSITVSTADTNLLADCGLRLVIEVVPPVELTVTVKYAELSYANGEIKEEWKTKVLPNKIWSTPNYTKINKVAFYDGDTNIGIPAQGEFIDEKTRITDGSGNRIERLTYDGIILSAADNATATAMITVKYIRNSLFRVYDNVTDDYRFVKTYSNSSEYPCSDFISAHDGYRVKTIESGNLEYARVISAATPNDWANARVSVLCQLSSGNIIPLNVIYTDKWQITVEYLEDYKNSGFAVKKAYTNEVKIKDDNGNLAFKDINKPTADEVAKFLGKNSAEDLTVVRFGAVNSERISVSCENDVYTIKLDYGRAALKAIQSDGSYEYINIPLSNFADWASGYGKDWSILVLNTKDKIIFKSEFDVKPENLYGYFYVAIFKEQVKNLDGLFAGYTADGCRSFYDCKKVVGSELYKTCNNMGTLGTVLCLGINKVIQAAGETLHDDYGTYYSYFLFVDGSSALNYSANNKADNYFDTDSATKNTFENIGENISEWWQKGGAAVKFIQIILGLIAALVIITILTKIIDVILKIVNKNKRR